MYADPVLYQANEDDSQASFSDHRVGQAFLRNMHEANKSLGKYSFAIHINSIEPSRIVFKRSSGRLPGEIPILGQKFKAFLMRVQKSKRKYTVVAITSVRIAKLSAEANPLPE